MGTILGMLLGAYLIFNGLTGGGGVGAFLVFILASIIFLTYDS